MRKLSLIHIYNKYIDKVGTIINAEVYQIWKKEMLLLDDEGNELLLPKTEPVSYTHLDVYKRQVITLASAIKGSEGTRIKK